MQTNDQKIMKKCGNFQDIYTTKKDEKIAKNVKSTLSTPNLTPRFDR